MKFIKLFFLVFIFASFQTSCQKKKEFNKAKLIISELDKLNTKSEIESYIQKIDTNYKKFELKAIQDFTRGSEDSLVKLLANKIDMTSSHVKVDIDNNGYTDLLAIGDDHTCISFRPDEKGEKSCDFSTIFLMNFENGISKVIDINKNLYSPIAPKIEYIDSEPFLVIHQPKKIRKFYREGENEKRIQLKYIFGDFIENNDNPNKYNIEKIEYSTTPCYGSCPEFEIVINKDRTARFIAKHFNFYSETEKWTKKDEGIFKTTIKQKEFTEIIDILNYIDFPNLENGYSVNWTDDQSSKLKITFNNGLTKTINDYGLVGTYGLKRVYQMIFELRKNQNWK